MDVGLESRGAVAGILVWSVSFRVSRAGMSCMPSDRTCKSDMPWHVIEHRPRERDYLNFTMVCLLFPSLPLSSSDDDQAMDPASNGADRSARTSTTSANNDTDDRGELTKHRETIMASQQKSLLLELPAELRNTIYEYVFEGSTTEIFGKHTEESLSTYLEHFTLYEPREGWFFKHTPVHDVAAYGLPPLLAVNRQIRDEAIGIFYAQARWITHEMEYMIPLLKKLGRKRTTLSRSITLSVLRPYKESDKRYAKRPAMGLGALLSEKLEELPKDLFLGKTRLTIEVGADDGEILWQGTLEVGE